MKCNLAMQRLLDASVRTEKVDMIPLEHVLGSIKDCDGIIVSDVLQKLCHDTRDKFFDESAYEYYVNSLHMSDVDIAPEKRLGAALLMAMSIRRAFPNVAVVLIAENNDVVVKFFKMRPGQIVMASNLEDYSQAVLLLE